MPHLRSLWVHFFLCPLRQWNCHMAPVYTPVTEMNWLRTISGAKSKILLKKEEHWAPISLPLSWPKPSYVFFCFLSAQEILRKGIITALTGKRGKLLHLHQIPSEIHLHACQGWHSASCFVVSFLPEGWEFLQRPVGNVNKIIRRWDSNVKGATLWNIWSFTWFRACCHFKLYLKNVFAVQWRE